MKTIKGLALFLAQFVRDHTIRVTEKAFDDVADGTDAAGNLRMLGVRAEAAE